MEVEGANVLGLASLLNPKLQKISRFSHNFVFRAPFTVRVFQNPRSARRESEAKEVMHILIT